MVVASDAVDPIGVPLLMAAARVSAADTGPAMSSQTLVVPLSIAPFLPDVAVMLRL